MSKGLDIRPFQAGDANGIHDVIVPIQTREFGVPITFEDQPDLTVIAGFYQHGAGDFWVAESDGQIIGTISLLDIGDGAAALRKMFVHADWRGREHGTAQRLLDTLMDHARGTSLATIYLGTTALFIAAHRFYEKNGFELIDESQLPSSFPKLAVDTRFYKFDLRDK